MKKFIKSLFSSKGEVSSKRFFAMWLMLDLTVYIFVPVPNPIIVGSLLGTIISIILGQVISKT
ncbi:MAG: hypothetical protein ACYDEI_00150 [Erysipelotrichaceae bacterium]